MVDIDGLTIEECSSTLVQDNKMALFGTLTGS